MILCLELVATRRTTPTGKISFIIAFLGGILPSKKELALLHRVDQSQTLSLDFLSHGDQLLLLVLVPIPAIWVTYSRAHPKIQVFSD
jgi:hypothetical protein